VFCPRVSLEIVTDIANIVVLIVVELLVKLCEIFVKL